MVYLRKSLYTFLIGLVALLVLAAIADLTAKEEKNPHYAFVKTPYYSYFRYIEPLEAAPQQPLATVNVPASSEIMPESFPIPYEVPVVRHHNGHFSLFGVFKKPNKRGSTTTTTPAPVVGLVSGTFPGFPPDELPQDDLVTNNLLMTIN